MSFTGSTCSEIEAKIHAMVRLRPLAVDSTLSSTLLNDAVNWTLREIQRLHDWKAMRTVLESLSTTAGIDYVELPATYKRMSPGQEDDGCIFRLDSADDWVKVPLLYQQELLTFARLRELFPDPLELDEPSYACVEGRRIYFGPTPDDAYDLRIPCLSFTAAISGSDQNWFTENLEEALVEGGTARACIWLNQAEEAERRLARFRLLVDEAAAEEAHEAASRVGSYRPRVKNERRV